MVGLRLAPTTARLAAHQVRALPPQLRYLSGAVAPTFNRTSFRLVGRRWSRRFGCHTGSCGFAVRAGRDASPCWVVATTAG